jgi:hypothetical protein
MSTPINMQEISILIRDQDEANKIQKKTIQKQKKHIRQLEEAITKISERFDEISDECYVTQLENTKLLRENDELKRQAESKPQRKQDVRRNAEYAKRYLKNGQTVTLKLENGNWIKAFWDGINNQFIVHSSYKDGMEFFDDLQEVGKYFVKNYLIERKTFWYAFKDESGKSIAYLHLKKTPKRRTRR